ncbi:MAG: hypothetical protein A2822_01670 [Candidatus Staskawiczbacteria bacterium RIFCSPHIGHO2_01_FULL_41_41]|uniref:Uncharacterized protein n=1 Tax=Candidatus Staskawiczbacteria bacterium RIFCSPHIGHO2_01_FULL_41_41 TaxID=1802203 RepID=A0A1G2HW26_9BACT|nr:MAG: hypothetical protein A2822_01670 [Candidatus Staskawiczbacteria bacterium RIFCSPHIGHO2_01_FULL_41_41]
MQVSKWAFAVFMIESCVIGFLGGLFAENRWQAHQSRQKDEAVRTAYKQFMIEFSNAPLLGNTYWMRPVHGEPFEFDDFTVAFHKAGSHFANCDITWKNGKVENHTFYLESQPVWSGGYGMDKMPGTKGTFMVVTTDGWVECRYVPPHRWAE